MQSKNFYGEKFLTKSILHLILSAEGAHYSKEKRLNFK
jgi:hypothetical protein